VPVVLKSDSLNFLESQGPVQICNGIDFVGDLYIVSFAEDRRRKGLHFNGRNEISLTRVTFLNVKNASFKCNICSKKSQNK
jgi:hypothetical protein